MKNKKGFTLIELLAVFVIMFMILSVAIYSFINIRKAKKEDAKRRTIQTVEAAAKDFFDTNAYYYESLMPGDGSYIRVSLGKLVSEDYLGVVTDPTTSKTLNNCDYVEVKKDSNGNYSYKYVKNSGSDVCDTYNFIIVSEYKAPEVTLRITTTNKGNNNYYITGVNVLAHVIAGTSKIREVKYCTSIENCIPSQNIEVVVENEHDYNMFNPSKKNDSTGIDGNHVVTAFMAKNRAGKSTTAYVTYKKDTENPTCGSNNGSTTWTKSSRTIRQYCSDNTSGCTNSYYENTYSSTKLTDKINIEDNAGNKNDCNVNVYVDNTKPRCGSNNGSTTWTNQNRMITQQCIDDESGCDSVSETYTNDKKTDTLTITDGVGNTNTCDVNVYVDKTRPKCSLTLSGTKGNKVGTLQWYKSNVDISGSYSDDFGVVKDKGLSTSSGSTNGKTSGKQSSETSGVTWYGYVTDQAGNSNSCSKTFGLEKSVTLSFNLDATNDAIATDSRAHGGKVFNTSKSSSIKPYGNGSGNCLRQKDSSFVGCAEDSGSHKYYFGKSCENIGDFIRSFNVSSKSGVSTAVWGGNETTTTGLNHIDSESYSKKQSPDSKFNSSYKAKELNNNGSRINFTRHVFSYTSPAGNTSNKISLYTEYSVNCGYE